MNVRINSVRITVSDYLRNYQSDGTESGLPTISESDFTVPDSKQYEINSISWIGDENYKIGSKRNIEIYLNALEKERSNDNYTYYYFSGSYDSTNVHVTGGDFVSARLEGNYALRVVISLKGLKGVYEAPTSAAWSASTLGLASWTAPTNTSGYYKVCLYRDGVKLANITTDQTALNLYPYMTKGGAYYFAVSSIPYTSEQIGVGKESSELQSVYLNVSDDLVSDGTGQYSDSKYILNSTGSSSLLGYNTSETTIASNTYDYNSGTSYTVYNASTGQTTVMPGHENNEAGNGNSSSTTGNWYKEGNYWYFKTSSGNLVKDDWIIWKNAYYRFDSDGKMITGFYNKNENTTYYLSNSGAMKTGWVLVNNTWYYMNPEPGEYYGLMYRGTVVNIGEKSYFFDADGRMRTGWIIIRDQNGIDQYYYFYPKTTETGENYGHMAKSTTVLGGYTIAGDGHWVH
ncbi:hypothetical protein [Oribacterium sp. WCC10]|uniref:hypothetical protein n=1 Tax=Oribacterium sp. WCC10 TaxID=1855343 RepID=UPI00158700FD|nr:hypothetical protein [Oribacterium sp. WCC10]